MAGLETDDIRAAVAAGVIDEAQAASLAALAHRRRGHRDAMQADDEPFELFRGFNEVFVAVGVALLGLGFWAFSAVLSGALLVPAVLGGALAWLLAEYFTRRRRMIMPSLLLVTGWAISCAALAALFTPKGVSDPTVAAVIASGACAGALSFYWRFRVPFSLFVAGLSALVAVLVIAGLVDPAGWRALDADGPSALFDLRQAGAVALAALVFGLVVFVIAMRFDLSDPHRVSRRSASAFWLHLIAAPAIVNTVLLTLYNTGSTLALAALAALIGVLTLVALVIDRRSFLMSALLYLGLLLWLALDGVRDDDMILAAIPLALGLFVTALGAGWTGARTRLMRALPDFPGKRRLPPYAEGA